MLRGKSVGPSPRERARLSSRRCNSILGTMPTQVPSDRSREGAIPGRRVALAGIGGKAAVAVATVSCATGVSCRAADVKRPYYVDVGSGARRAAEPGRRVAILAGKKVATVSRATGGSCRAADVTILYVDVGSGARRAMNALSRLSPADRRGCVAADACVGETAARLAIRTGEPATVS